MAKIISSGTGPEKLVRKMLSSLGYHFRLNVKTLPGKPDIVLRKYNAIIFVHGCFWHLHSNCRDGTIPKTKVDYWEEKLLRNKQRDVENFRKLRRQGWKILRLWACQIELKPEKVINILQNFLLADC